MAESVAGLAGTAARFVDVVLRHGRHVVVSGAAWMAVALGRLVALDTALSEQKCVSGKWCI